MDKSSGNEYFMEQPAYGHMRFTFWWLMVLHLGGDSIITPWCGYIRSGPVYLKLTVLMFPRRSIFWKKLFKGSTCKKPHVKLEGSLATLAAACPEGFSEQVGEIVKEEMPERVGPWLPHHEVPVPTRVMFDQHDPDVQQFSFYTRSFYQSASHGDQS